MKKLIGLLLLLGLTAHGAGTFGYLQYNTNTLGLSPTNTMASNVLAGTGLAVAQGINGRLTLSAPGAPFLSSTGGVVSGPVTSTSSTTNAPSATEFTTADWVRRLLLNGYLGYNSSNLAPGYVYGAVPYLYTNQLSGNVFSRTYAGATLSNNGYYGAVAITNLTSIAGPIVVSTYLAAMNGSGGSPSLTIKPELYYSYDNGTNLLGNWDCQAQSLTLGITNRYDFVVSVPSTMFTQAATVYRAFKVVTVTGVTKPDFVIVGGTTNYPSQISYNVQGTTSLPGYVLTNNQVGPIHLNGDSYTTNGLYLSSAGEVLSNANGSVTFNGGNQTNTGTLGVGGSATFNGGVTVTNAATGPQALIGGPLGLIVTNSAGVTWVGVGRTPTGPFQVQGSVWLSSDLSWGVANFAGPYGRAQFASPGDGYMSIVQNNGKDFSRLVFGTNAITGTNIAALSIVNSTNNTTVPQIKVTSQSGTPADLIVGGKLGVNSVTLGSTLEIATSNTTDIPLTVWTNGGVAMQVDAAGKMTVSGVLTNVGSLGVGGSIRSSGAIYGTHLLAASGYRLGFDGLSAFRTSTDGRMAVGNVLGNDFSCFIFGTNSASGTNFAALSIVNSTNNTLVPAIKVTSQSGTPADLIVGGQFFNTNGAYLEGGITNNGSTTVGPLTVGTNGGVAVQVDAAGRTWLGNGLHVSNYSTTLPAFQVRTNGSTNSAFVIDQKGNVGIGADAAGFGGKLTVNGATYVVGNVRVDGNVNANSSQFTYSTIPRTVTAAGFRAITNATLSRVLTCTIVTNSGLSLWVDYTIRATEGITNQVLSGTILFDAANLNGTITTNITDVPTFQRTLATAGTLTAAWSAVPGANTIALWVTPTTTCTTTNFDCATFVRGNVFAGTLSVP